MKNLLLKMIAPERDFRGFCNLRKNNEKNVNKNNFILHINPEGLKQNIGQTLREK